MNRAKEAVKRIIRHFGFNITRVPDIGFDPFADMRKFMCPTDAPMIFDVGANCGQSVIALKKAFPRAIIHSFEPSPEVFGRLQEVASSHQDVHAWNLGMGSEAGEKLLLENSMSVRSSFLEIGPTGSGRIEKETVAKVETVDRFCEAKGIEYIDILKNDTQGFELEVLRGAESLMRQSKVGMIHCEMVFADDYKGNPQPDQIYGFLIGMKYSLVSFYNFHYRRDLVEWADLLFVHDSLRRVGDEAG